MFQSCISLFSIIVIKFLNRRPLLTNFKRSRKFVSYNLKLAVKQRNVVGLVNELERFYAWSYHYSLNGRVVASYYRV